MEQIEKVCKGLECCILLDPDDKARCDACPYDGACANRLKVAALALIRQQQERINELEEAQRVMVCQDCVKDMARLITDEDFKKADANGNIPAWIEYTPEWKNADHVWALIDRNIFNFKYKRAWTQRPTDEQRKAVKWE